MKRVIAIGELLIDFVPKVKGLSLKDIDEFIKSPGGAPANVAACVAKLGGTSQFIGQVGQDGFGDCLIEALQKVGVDTSHILQTSKAKTALAFVSLKEDGDRDFSFYRNPSADMLLSPEQIDESWFKDDILHFCSVSLIDAPIKRSHEKVIQIIRNNGGIISFDPNVRLPLWNDPDKCRQVILEFLPTADIVKISEEELAFITGLENYEEAIASLFQGHVKLVICTKGPDGASIHTKTDEFHQPGLSVNVADTTAAGDSFIGSFLFCLAKSNKKIEELEESELKQFLEFSNIVGALTTTKPGAIDAIPTLQDVNQYYDQYKN